MPIQFEPGYTPANLRALLKHAGLTQHAAGELLAVDMRTVRKWCAPLDSDHADMPHYRWLQLLAATGASAVPAGVGRLRVSGGCLLVGG